MPDYLQDLNVRLSSGLAMLPADVRARHASFILSCQAEDGGWPGREGESDLYYTGFGLRGLSVLDALTPEVAAHAAGFLRASLTRQASVVDLFSLLYSMLLVQAHAGIDVLEDSPADWPERVGALLETFRTSDGGYNKTPGAASGSTYHTFLVGLCYNLLGRAIPDGDAVVKFVRARQRDDGGYVEVAAMRRSGSNPTAAALGILQLQLGENLPADELAPTLAYLGSMTSMEGGLRANDRIPLADLLSTFTGCWSLASFDALDRIDVQEARRFVESLALDTGGFHGGLWDAGTDVEYTFYGLGCLGLFASP